MRAIVDFDTIVPATHRARIRAAGLAGFPTRRWLSETLRYLRRHHGNHAARAASAWLRWIGTYPIR